MARKKKEPVHHVQMTNGNRAIIQQLFQEYDIESAEDIQDALKNFYGTKRKQVNSSYGPITIDVPQDRESTFQPQVVKKRQKDISNIDQKIISMYAKGITTMPIRTWLGASI